MSSSIRPYIATLLLALATACGGSVGSPAGTPTCYVQTDPGGIRLNCDAPVADPRAVLCSDVKTREVRDCSYVLAGTQCSQVDQDSWHCDPDGTAGAGGESGDGPSSPEGGAGGRMGPPGAAGGAEGPSSGEEAGSGGDQTVPDGSAGDGGDDITPFAMEGLTTDFRVRDAGTIPDPDLVWVRFDCSHVVPLAVDELGHPVTDTPLQVWQPTGDTVTSATSFDPTAEWDYRRPESGLRYEAGFNFDRIDEVMCDHRGLVPLRKNVVIWLVWGSHRGPMYVLDRNVVVRVGLAESYGTPSKGR